MPLSESSSPRSLKHTRTTTVASYRRADGLWEIDAHLTDIKTTDSKLETGIRVAGDPMHDLWLRVTYTTDFTIVDAQAASDRAAAACFGLWRQHHRGLPLAQWHW